tara:strand:- start:111 stop:377 length:267 start_codon:yes stop_codon:yes gene_type:complete
MAFKGTLPSDLWERYDGEGGQERMTLDLLVAMDMSDKISEASTKAKKKFDGKGMASRLKQRREQRQLLNDNETVSLLKGLGLPVERSE